MDAGRKMAPSCIHENNNKTDRLTVQKKGVGRCNPSKPSDLALNNIYIIIIM